jgi:hypothetical protein
VPRHNGIALGDGSPLLTAAGAKRLLQASEEDVQIAVMNLLVGPVRKGEPRRMGDGMTGRHPELYLLHAIPNGGGRSKATAGRMKAQGVLGGMPDLHLPVMRGPFLSLYVELKVKGTYGKAHQRQLAALLRAEGHAVVEAQGTEEATSVIMGYLALPKNRPSVRPLGALGGAKIVDALARWRDEAHAMLTPHRR